MIYFNLKIPRVGGLGDFVARIDNLSRELNERFGTNAKLCMDPSTLELGHTSSYRERDYLVSFLKLEERFDKPPPTPANVIIEDRMSAPEIFDQVKDGDVVDILRWNNGPNKFVEENLPDISELRNPPDGVKRAVLHLRRADLSMLKTYDGYHDPFLGLDSNSGYSAVFDRAPQHRRHMVNNLKHITDPFTRCNYQRFICNAKRVLFTRNMAKTISERLKLIHGFDEVVLISDGIEKMFNKTLPPEVCYIDRVSIHNKIKDLENTDFIDKVIMKGERDDFIDTANCLLNADLVVTVSKASITVISSMARVPTIEIFNTDVIDFARDELLVNKFDKKVIDLV